jgi:hypothetical protein
MLFADQNILVERSVAKMCGRRANLPQACVRKRLSLETRIRCRKLFRARNSGHWWQVGVIWHKQTISTNFDIAPGDWSKARPQTFTSPRLRCLQNSLGP